MKHISPLLAILGASPAATMLAQFEGDNIRYATISLEELPRSLKEHPGALVLDVRSEGEYNETSEFAGLNIGRIKGALNIPIDSIAKRYKELLPYREKPIYVYCSHSQRSRRVSDQLADSGFSHLSNVNAGLTRYWLERERMRGMDPLIEGKRAEYSVDPTELCRLIGSGATIIDLRADSLYDPAKAPEAFRIFGRLKGSLHIPAAELEQRLGEIPKGRDVVLFDVFGGTAPTSREVLTSRGYGPVHVLFNGLESILYATPDRFPCGGAVLERPIPYALVLPSVIRKEDVRDKYTVIDVRPNPAFNGQAEEAWQNIGRVVGSINVPTAEIQANGLGNIDKEARILVVGDNNAEYNAARSICDRGYRDVTVLVGGLRKLRWTAHNIEGRADLEQLIEGVPVN